MPRNLDHRVEVAFPILDARLQAEVREVLDIQLSDTVKARLLQPDGTSIRVRPEGEGAVGVRSQDRIYELIGTRRD
jgi:polyphosphate kinase